MTSNTTRRMLVICPFPEGCAAQQRLKYEQYFADWRSAGWEIEVSSFLDRKAWDVLYKPGHLLAKAWGTLKGYLRRSRDITRTGRYDLVYVCMWATPFFGPLFERLIRARARALVYDIEDNVLSGADGQADNPNPMSRLLKSQSKFLYLIREADHVITSSPFLNETCMGINRARACTYISSSVDTDRFQPATPYSNDKPVVIGWTGTFSSSVYLDLLRGVFQRLAQKVPFRLRVIGNFDYELPGVDLEVIRWSAAEEVAQLQALDIGVYPLPIDDWVLGKSGLKAIQYMAFALPCVATEVGTTPMIIQNERNGILVKTEQEWELALERLIAEPTLRRQLGEAARKDAVAKYSLAAIAGQYRAVIESAIEQGSNG
ncbi:glycosyltransferase family 4 protein [Novosphingobium sp.]|uniref:glycosyltransferase family 4 protein n=1 Tax=Novosphingobium sp. TaxID=1874826 RepID=UPI00286D6AB8|nr:glycosyltransferase family 4 protein [Novosphingobium sp.]